jgi:FtsZ-binding cell division protein ZapB
MKNLDFGKLLPYVVIVLLVLGLLFYFNKVNKLDGKVESEIKLGTALLDTVTTYKNKHNEVVTEKLSLQAAIKELTKTNINLTSEQKDLMGRVKEVEKKNNIITAALIKSKIKIDSLQKSNVYVDAKDSTITFTPVDKTNFDYEIMVLHVSVYTKINPELVFKKLEFSNTQFVEFHWKDNKKEGYPIAFSVSNSNPNFSTANIDSYSIPELKKSDIKPSFWKRMNNGIGKVGKPVIFIGVGAAATWLIMK